MGDTSKQYVTMTPLEELDGVISGLRHQQSVLQTYIDVLLKLQDNMTFTTSSADDLLSLERAFLQARDAYAARLLGDPTRNAVHSVVEPKQEPTDDR